MWPERLVVWAEVRKFRMGLTLGYMRNRNIIQNLWFFSRPHDLSIGREKRCLSASLESFFVKIEFLVDWGCHQKVIPSCDELDDHDHFPSRSGRDVFIFKTPPWRCHAPRDPSIAPTSEVFRNFVIGHLLFTLVIYSASAARFAACLLSWSESVRPVDFFGTRPVFCRATSHRHRVSPNVADRRCRHLVSVASSKAAYLLGAAGMRGPAAL